MRITSVSSDKDVLGGIRDDNQVMYKYLDFGDGADSFTVNVTPKTGGKLEVWIDNMWTPPVGVVDIPASAAGKPQTLTVPVTPVKGVHTLILRFAGDKEAKELFTVDWFKFAKK